MEHEKELRASIREIPDFPKEGILFYDLSTMFLDKRAFALTVDILTHRYMHKEKIDAVLCIEARGFVTGSAVAYRLGQGVVMARKKGKLPGKTISVTYDLEYGTDEIFIHDDAIKKGDRILIIDDLLATGGTAAATVDLVKKCGGEVVECAFIVELPDLKGRDKLKGLKVYSMLEYEGA